MENYLQESYYFNYNSEEIKTIVEPFKSIKRSVKDNAIELFRYVRDNWFYNPYIISFRKESFKASTIALSQKGHCIYKSILLIACYRAIGIPARLKLAKVKNHLGVERIEKVLKTNILSPHGYVSIYINKTWIDVSPAFNTVICKYLNLETLDFDGENNALLHQFDKKGNICMEYIEEYGHFADVPLEFIRCNAIETYPDFFTEENTSTGQDFVF